MGLNLLSNPGSSWFRGNTASNKEYFDIFHLLNKPNRLDLSSLPLDEKQQVDQDLDARRKQLTAAKQLHQDQQGQMASKHAAQLQVIFL